MGMPEHLKFTETDEGKIFILGMGLLGLYLGVIALSSLFFPGFYKVATAVSATNIVVGRVPGITLGFAMDASFYTVVGINFVVEMLLVLFLYPLFILSWNRLLDIGKLEKWASSARRSAEKYQPLLKKYGLVGLFVFVWFPFWMTGPIIGSIIGYLLGFRHWVTLSIVLSGTLIAISCWSLVLRYVHEWAFAIDPKGPWLIVALIAVLILAAYLIRKLSRR